MSIILFIFFMATFKITYYFLCFNFNTLGRPVYRRIIVKIFYKMKKFNYYYKDNKNLYFLFYLMTFDKKIDKIYFVYKNLHKIM